MGKQIRGEIPLNVAKRELQEEIGYRAQTIVPLGIMHPTPAYLTEALALFYATDLEFVGQNLDEGEELHVHQLKLSRD
ncbi:NUDIX hydrolase [Erysipelothrix sp. D19-032]